MKARGKRGARRPWVTNNQTYRSPERAELPVDISAFQALIPCARGKPGATRSASLRACPWLSYSAPLALRIACLPTSR